MGKPTCSSPSRTARSSKIITAMEQTASSDRPAFGTFNAEFITEAIQGCHVSLEESRLLLVPLAEILHADDDDRADLKRGSSNAGPHAQVHLGNCSDLQVVKGFAELIERVFASIDMLATRLADNGLIALDQNNNRQEHSVYLLMASNCIAKSADFIGHNCLTLLESDSLDESFGPLDDHAFIDGSDDMRIQPCMARLAELALRAVHIHAALKPFQNNDVFKHDDGIASSSIIIESYSQYQRRCLRARSKPAISSVAELRRLASSQNCFVSDLLEAESRREKLEACLDAEVASHGGGNGMDGTAISRGQPHAQAITVVLGEASSLIQPLAAWIDALSPQKSETQNDFVTLLRQLCQESIEILDSEAQTLAVTVGSWFRPDQRGFATLDQDSTIIKDSDLVSVESSLEEMAFLCQVISRYCHFSEQIRSWQGTNNVSNSDSDLQNLLTEQSLHYSTLETRLATLQFNQALSLASPQLIELGRPLLQVPSIVEDAHFICMRAIERAAGTRSERAVWTVGHWVCEVWSVDRSSGMTGMNGDVMGVYRALMQGVGCTSVAFAENMNYDESKSRDEVFGARSKVDSAVSAALLEPVGDIVGRHEGIGGSSPGSGLNGAHNSGVLSTFFRRDDLAYRLQSGIDAELCALNGISAAETACLALSGLFSDLIEEKLQEQSTGIEAPPKSSSMPTFARDELASHSRSYHNLLQQQVCTLVTDLCGGGDIYNGNRQLCLQNLRLFIENEVYNLDSSSFRSLESEDRLEAELIEPMRQSRILDEIRQDKCDAAVVLGLAEAMSWKATEIILEVLLKGSAEFNEWGAMLLSKQIRMLQNIYCSLILDLDASSGAKSAKPGVSSISTASILTQFERINQAVSILQLEKPSDWLAFAYKVGDEGETNLAVDEIQRIMSLRVDFSEEAIARVCMQIKS